MRKYTFAFLVALAVVALQLPIASVAHAAPVNGEVTKVDPAAGKITLRHEPIKNLDMDSMTMVFRIADPAMLRTVKPGDRVRVRNDFVPGHVRMPGYIRGKTGVVVAESPAYPFPDAHAHGVKAADEPTYDVRFDAEELWPNAADPAFVHVGVFQSYLERAA